MEPQENLEIKIKDLSEVLSEIQKKVLNNRTQFDDTSKTVKDFRRLFDQQSSRMNQAIFNGQPSEEINLETLKTVSILVEILSRTKTKNAK